MRLIRSLALGSLLLALASCSATTPTPTAAGPTYTCCEAAEINRTYQPGDNLALHWIVAPGHGPTGEVVLTAHLTGPYPSPDELKQANGSGADSTFSAEPVRPSGEPPVSLIPIPSSARPGYYNLTTSINGTDSVVSGGAVIQVIP